MQQGNPEDAQKQTMFPPHESSGPASGPQFMFEKKEAEAANNQTVFYTKEDDSDLALPPIEDQNHMGSQSAPFVLPFQHSDAMPTIQQGGAAGTNTPGEMPSSPKAAPVPKRSLPVLRIVLIAGIVFVTLMGASLFVFAQQGAPASTPRTSLSNGTQTNIGGTTPTIPVPSPQQAPTPPPGSAPQAPTSSPAAPMKPAQSGNQGQGTPVAGQPSSGDIPSGQLLNQLGWTQAGLSLGDAIEVLRTGATFTDREMSYDYRNIGTRGNHSGTLTGSTFLLTAGGKVRFLHNDVREINNVLYDKISTGKIIQQVVGAQPALVQFQERLIQGQKHQIAWVNVAFELFVSRIDPASGTHTSTLARDATTGQPLLHHLVVVLVRGPAAESGSQRTDGWDWVAGQYLCFGWTGTSSACN